MRTFHKIMALAIFALPVSALGDLFNNTSNINQTSSQQQTRTFFETDCARSALIGMSCPPGYSGDPDNCNGFSQAQGKVESQYCIIPLPKGACGLMGFEKKSTSSWSRIASNKLAQFGTESDRRNRNPNTCVGAAQIAADNVANMNGFSANSFGSIEKETLSGGSSGEGLFDKMTAGLDPSEFSEENLELLKKFYNGEDPQKLLAEYQDTHLTDQQKADRESAASHEGEYAEADIPGYDSGGGGSTAVASAAGGDLFGDLLNGNGDSIDPSDPFKDALKAMEDANDKEAAKRALAAGVDPKLAKQFRSMLNRSLFEMVRDQYQKQSKDLVGMDQFLKRQQRQRVKDVKSVVKGSTSAKL